MNFADKIAFVTGAGGGIGFQIARDLLAAGAKVTMFDLKPAPSELPGSPENRLYIQGDLTDDKQVESAVADTVETFGALDCLANVAGALLFAEDRSALEIDLDVWDRVMAINLKSMVLCCRHAVPLMRRTGPEKPEVGGSMVHISSIQALRGDDLPQDAAGGRFRLQWDIQF